MLKYENFPSTNFFQITVYTCKLGKFEGVRRGNVFACLLFYSNCVDYFEAQHGLLKLLIPLMTILDTEDVHIPEYSTGEVSMMNDDNDIAEDDGEHFHLLQKINICNKQVYA